MNLKQLFTIIFGGTLAILLLGCGADRSTFPPLNTPILNNTPVPATESSATEVEYDENDPGLNLLVATSGEVLLRRTNWNDFHPTAFGVSLQRGDLLKVQGGAQATILCDNLNTWIVPTGAAPSGLSGCPRPAESFLVRQGGRIISTRGGDPTVPYIISPRSTKLLSHTPALRWNDTGSASYSVTVRGGDINWSQEGIRGTKLIYPGEPALEPGSTYLLIVEDENGRSSQDEGRAGLGFSLLEEAGIQQIQSKADHIAGLGLSGEAENFAVAQFYAGNGLMAEAIEILETLVEAGSQQALVHQGLADLYRQIGLLLLAKNRYLAAIELAEAQNNVEAMADIQASLGEVYPGLGNENEAIMWLTQARGNYDTLGDIERVKQVEEWLELLK